MAETEHGSPLKDLGLPGGLSRTDVLGLFIPGALIVLVSGLILPRLREHFSFASPNSAADILYFVIFSFVAGYLLQAVASAFDRLILPVGFPTHWVRVEKRADYLHPNQLKRLRELLIQRFSVSDLPAFSAYSSGFTGVAVQIRAAIASAGLDGRLQEYIHSFNLYKSMYVAFLILLFQVILVRIFRPLIHGDISSITLNWVSHVELVVAFVSFAYCARSAMVEYARSYARELYVVYLELDRVGRISDQATQPSSQDNCVNIMNEKSSG